MRIEYTDINDYISKLEELRGLEIDTIEGQQMINGGFVVLHTFKFKRDASKEYDSKTEQILLDKIADIFSKITYNPRYEYVITEKQDNKWQVIIDAKMEEDSRLGGIGW